jgi:acetyl esterase/lipase
MDMAYTKQTYIYKTVDNCQIQADVYRSPGKERRAAILWLHGGGLIFGDRGMLPREQMELYLKAGYAVVAIDYRLAPETKLPAILEDVQEAYYWVRRQGAGLFNVDPDRLAVVGHSAGGYLTLMTGFNVDPRPKALVSFYGYGDIVGDWYSRPDPFYNREPAVSPEMARQGIGSVATTGSESDDFTESRWLFYLYCRQQGLWPKEVTGCDPHSDLEVFTQLCPVRNITQDYPPTLLLHGDMDTDVPFEQSELMAAALMEHNVPHRLITMEGFGHVFDIHPEDSSEAEPRGSRSQKVIEAFEAVVAFLNEQMESRG